MDGETQRALIAAAIAGHGRAYAPYSHFQVGAAVLDSSGRIFAGCNVENVSYGLTSCAERNAIFRAMVEGARSIRAVAVVTAADANGKAITATPYFYGTVTGVKFKSTGTAFVVDGEDVDLANILEVI